MVAQKGIESVLYHNFLHIRLDNNYFYYGGIIGCQIFTGSFITLLSYESFEFMKTSPYLITISIVAP